MIISSPLEEWTWFLDSLEDELTDPHTLKPTPDLWVLSCGCVVGRSGSTNNTDNYNDNDNYNANDRCALCGTRGVATVAKLDRLQNMYHKVQAQRTKLGAKLLKGDLAPDNRSYDSSASSAQGSTVTSNIDFAMLDERIHESQAFQKQQHQHQHQQQTPMSLLELFQSVASEITATSSSTSGTTSPTPATLSSSSTTTTTTANTTNTANTNPASPSTASASASASKPASLASHSNPASQSSTPKLQPTSVLFTGPLSQSQSPLLPAQLAPDNERREHNYTKCFPMFRKQFQHCTQPRTLWHRTSKKQAFASCISPDAVHFAIASSSSKFQVYQMPGDFNDGPALVCEPQLDGVFPDPMLSMSNDMVAIAGRNGRIRIFDFQGNVHFEQDTNLEIHCLALSPYDSMLAFGIYGRNPHAAAAEGGTTSSNNTPMVVMHLLDEQPQGRAISIVIPYHDTLSVLAFSTDETFLTCATLAESRFMMIAIDRHHKREPRLVMKSSRRVDPDDEFEGITSLRFFPTAAFKTQHMVITSSVITSSAPPIVLDTKIAPGSQSSSTTSSQSQSQSQPRSTSTSTASSSVSRMVSQPTMVMRVDKVGSRVYNSAISPRCDAMAFLDKSGLVYVMHSPGLLPDQRRVAVATGVAQSATRATAASMQFSPSGQVLFIVDRKGDLHIEDYGAGMPNQAGVGKCRLLG